jgi:hypothetical protein
MPLQIPLQIALSIKDMSIIFATDVIPQTTNTQIKEIKRRIKVRNKLLYADEDGVAPKILSFGDMSDVDIDIENKQNDDIQSEQEIASDSYSSDNNDINMEQRFDIPSETELNKLDQKKLKKLCRDNGLKVGGN